MQTGPFELLELPDGRWCVARIASAAGTLVAGSFAPIDRSPADTGPTDPVGIFASRDQAELAIQRADSAARHPLAPFAAWLRGG